MPTAEDIMTRNPVTVHPDDDIKHALETLVEKGINGLPVMEGTKLVGVITQNDLLLRQKTLGLPSLLTQLEGEMPVTNLESFREKAKELYKEMERISAGKVGKAMTTDPLTVSPNTPISTIADLMAEKKIYTLPVVAGGTLVGVIGKEDVLRAMI